MLQNLLLLGFELIVLGGVIFGLHYLRSRYGLILMLIFLGGLAAVLQYTVPMGVYWRPMPNLYLTPGSNVLVPVILLGVLLIYVTEGTAPARLATWGIVGINLLALFTLSSLSTQLKMPSGGSFVDLSSVVSVLHFSARQMTASMIAFLVDMYILAILYQAMINRCGLSERLKLWNAPPDSRAPIWLATLVALMGALWADTLVYISLAYAGTPALAENLTGQLIAKTISGIMIWPFAAAYLDRWASRLPGFNKTIHRRSFDMLFGSYAQLENALVRSEEALLRRAEELAVVALEKAQYASDLERSLAEMSALYNLAQKTTSSLDADKVLETIVYYLKEMLGARAVSITLLDPKTQTLSLGATAGIEEQWVQDFRLKVGEGVSGEVVATGQPIYVPDSQADQNFKFFSRAVRSLLVVPLKAKDRIVGTLAIDSDKPDAFSAHDEHLLSIAASQVAVAIENAQLYTKVQRLAVTDGLTGIANRRAFDEALQSEVIRATRYGHPLSLIFLDIDDFKIFNDTHGHPAGDEQLKEIAKILMNNVRFPDMVARYGGEEFVLLLPHTGKDGALKLAERIRVAAVNKAKNDLPGEHITLEVGNPISGYTISIGVASIHDDAHADEELLQAADWAVLEAKQTGKNRVCSA